MTLNGKGKQYILSQNSQSCDHTNVKFNSLPDKIFVNGILQNKTDYYIYII